jgi:hypothetical protein
MKKFILGIAVIAAVIISVPAFAAQENSNANVNTEITEEYVLVELKDLPEETQELLVNTFDGYDLMVIYQNTTTKLLQITVVKDEEKKVFVQNEDGTFVEQE